MSEEDFISMMEILEKKHQECGCGGTPAKPWNYCDDCQEYLKMLEQTPFVEGPF